MKYRLFYVAEGGLGNTVFDSQVFMLLKKLKQSAVKLHLCVIELFGVRKDDFIEEKLSIIKKELDGYTYMRGMPMLGRITSRIDSYRLLNLLKQQQVLSPDTIIHARGYFGAYTAINAFGGERVIADIRGLVSAEIKYYSSFGIRTFLKDFRINELNKMEEHIVRNSAKIFCVSHVLKRYLLDRYRVDENKIMVIPTIVDTNFFKYDQEARKKLRKKLGLEEKTIFIYSGGLAKWQLPDKIIHLFKKLKKEIPQAFLIFLTHKPSEAAPYFTDINRDDYLLKNVPYEKIAQYLNAADIGILLRENNLVNRVAAPTKFSEYLCCGLPVILTKGIGDTEEIISNTNGGVVIDNPDMIPSKDVISTLKQIDRDTLSKSVYETYSINEKVKSIKMVYESI